MFPSVPVSVGVWLFVAVMLWAPAVFKVALKWPTPLVRVTLAGRMALGSLLVMMTGPLRWVSGVPSAFRAVTVKLSACPAVGAVEAAMTARLGPWGTDHN